MMGVWDVIITPVTYCWAVLPLLIIDVHTWVGATQRRGRVVMLRGARRIHWNGLYVIGQVGSS